VTSWIGKSIAHYRVTAQIGAGGMGEVYRASDSRLGRDVAVKVLPAAFAEDPERMARFEREAKLLASLSHAHIAGIFGLEETNGTRALVMELVEGPTLADRIAKGAIAPDEALPIAKQIAEALEYAHERAIIHRDLKPANVKLTLDGGVKVLDFGLAKALSDDANASGSDLSKSPTLTAASTRLGVILGTAAYMSPEQAKGKAVDRRADIWAFGAVLFEMLTGRQAFAGETVSETLASVMKDEPDWKLLPASTPARVRDLLRRCLVKDPKQRLRDIGDARIRIEEEITGAPDASSITTTTSGAPSSRRSMLVPVVIVALVAAAVGLAGGFLLRKTPTPPMFRATLLFPDEMRLDEQNASVAISPDGRTVVLAASGKEQPLQLWVRRLDSDVTTPIAGTNGATYPFWSPDGRFIAFFADRKLKRVPANGGTVQTLCDAVDARGGSWSADGRIIFSPGPLTGLEIVAASGGTPQSLTALSKTGETHRLPRFLPDGKRALFVIGASDLSRGKIECLDIESKTITRVMECESEVRYLETGHLAFLIDKNLVVQRFDESSLKLSGEPVPIAESVQFNIYRYTGGWDLSRYGALLYTTGVGVQNGQLTWFDLDGRELGTLGTPSPVIGLEISPDGQRVVSSERGEQFDLWMWDVARGVRTRFTFGPDPAALGIWSHDGRTIYYANGTGNIFAKSADGASAATTIFEITDSWIQPESISPDGRELFISPQLRETGTDVWVKTLGDDAEPRKLFASPANEGGARLSPDARWFLMTSDESGREEVYAYPYPSLSGRWQVSSEGGRGGHWLPGGRAILYTTLDERLVRVDVDGSGESLRVGEGKTIFGGRAIPGAGAIAPDGKRLLVAVPQGGSALKLHLVTDWRSLLDGRASN
jgi:serine/threonine protein kinase/Tol biopolymer transport system component